MKRISSLGLRARMFFLVVLAGIPVLVMVGYTGIEQRQQAVQRVHEDVLKLARDKQRFIRDTRQFLFLLSRLPEVTESDAAGCNRFLAQFLKHSGPYSNFGFIQPNGDLY